MYSGPPSISRFTTPEHSATPPNAAAIAQSRCEVGMDRGAEFKHPVVPTRFAQDTQTIGDACEKMSRETIVMLCMRGVSA
jgi:hypothetical protein